MMFSHIYIFVVVGLTLWNKYIVHRPVLWSRCLMVILFCSLTRMADVGVNTMLDPVS